MTRGGRCCAGRCSALFVVLLVLLGGFRLRGADASLVCLPCRVDLSRLPSGMSLNGKLLPGGCFSTEGNYCVCNIWLSPSASPGVCRLQVTAIGDATFSACIYAMNDNRTAGRCLYRLCDGMVLGEPRQLIELSIPCSSEPIGLFLYNQNRRGKLLFENISLEHLP